MDLFGEIRKHGLDVRVVILTGYGSLESAVNALRWDADDYLTKPCGLSEIESVLARLLAQRRARARAELPRLLAEEPADPDLREPAAPEVDSRRTLEETEREQILAVLDQHHGHKPAAARQLGISLRTLYNKLNAYRIQGHLP